MKNNKSHNTIIETLSAYLDDQLPEAEAQVIRKRLAEDASLRAQIDELRQARWVLKQTPRLKRRRSFVLSPEMVRQQKTFFRAMSISRAISAAASVLLVVVLGSQYLLPGGMGFSAAPAADMAESANAEMADEASGAEPMMMLAPAEEETAAMDQPAEEPAEEVTVVAEAPAEPFVEETTPSPAAVEEPAADQAQGTLEPGGGGGLPPTPTETVEQALGNADAAATLEGEMRTMELEKEAGDALDEAATATDDGMLRTEKVLEPESRISPLQVTQGVLLLLALVGALTAAYFRKKVR